jgi:hypothetical protein
VNRAFLGFRGHNSEVLQARSQAYALVFDDARLPELEQVLLSFKSKTKQEAIYLEIHRHVEVRFLK